MSKDTLRTAFIVGAIICGVAFLALTADTLSQVPTRTKAQNLTNQAVAGKQAWQRHDCIGCHTILGNGAYYGPDLTKIAQTRGTAFLRTWLKNPAGQMPNQRLTDQEVEELVAFLSWVAGIDTNDWPPAPLGVTLAAPAKVTPAAPEASPTAPPGVTPVPSEELIPQGAALFESKGCVACHGPHGKGTGIAPSLKGVTTRYGLDRLNLWLKDPAAVKPGTAMPNLRLSKAEIEALVAYLEMLK